MNEFWIIKTLGLLFAFAGINFLVCGLYDLWMYKKGYGSRKWWFSSEWWRILFATKFSLKGLTKGLILAVAPYLADKGTINYYYATPDKRNDMESHELFLDGVVKIILGLIFIVILGKFFLFEI